MLSLGHPLDEWQDQANEAAMGERSNGKWASKFVGISAPRQNGKSELIVARALAGVLLFDEKMIIISAHETDTAREIWKRMIDIIEDNPSLEARLTGRMDAVNREFITFGRGKDRQTIKLKARQKAGGRGFSCDCLLLDEAQILSKTTWGAILPTMSARPNPQVWLFGTPPTESDDPFAFSKVRNSAIEGKARHCWLEWSASPDDDIDSLETWAKANPAFPDRVSEEAIADDRSGLDADQFCRERLGMWDDVLHQSVIPYGMWTQQADSFSLAVDRWALGIEVAPDAVRASVCLAGRRDDGRWHVELDESREGIAWVVAYVKALLEANPQIRGVGVDAGSPSKVLLDDFTAEGVHVITPKVQDLGSACTSLLAGVVAGEVLHIDQGQLNAAVKIAGKRPLADTGMWVWSRKNATSDITPVQAVTLALWVARLEDIWEPPLSGNNNGSVVIL